MAVLVVTFPDIIATRVVDGVIAQHGFDPLGGLTKAQFAQQVLARVVKEMVVAHEAIAAGETSRKTAEDKARTEITIT